MRLAIVLVAAALLAGACGEGPRKPIVIGPPPPGMAALYVLNTNPTAVFKTERTIYEDNRKIAAVSQKRFVVVALAPGRHRLGCDDVPLAGRGALDAVAGRIYYLQVATGSGAANMPGNRLCALITQKDAFEWLKDMHPEGAN